MVVPPVPSNVPTNQDDDSPSSRRKFTWKRLLKQLKDARFRLPGFGPRVLVIPPDLYVDTNGLPGDAPQDIPEVLRTISVIMDELGVLWFIAGDLLLIHYRVPKIMVTLEIVVPSEDLGRVRDAFNGLIDFCFPFRPAASPYTPHLNSHPRFKVRGMCQWFSLVPSHQYGLHHKRFLDIIRPLDKEEPFLPLPYYVQGLATVLLNQHTNSTNFRMQLEFLIDGSDIDEDWCNRHLDGRAQAFVRNLSSRAAKKNRMGPSPKYDGNLTTYIRDESQREDVLCITGRTIDNLDRSVSLQIMSDLHLELSFQADDKSRLGYVTFDCTPSSSILALLGDIGLANQDGLFSFLRSQLFKYQKVLFIMGNHEFYGLTFDSAKSLVQKFTEDVQRERNINSSLGEFIFLDQTRFDLTDKVTILGCTLWSHIPPSASEAIGIRLNDFKRIKEWSVERHNAAHQADADWLEKTCTEIRQQEPDRRLVILTHHAPLMDGTSSPQHQGGQMNSAFATDMSIRSCWSDPVTHWIFGHTHFNCDFIHKGVRVVSNQRGYEGVETPRLAFVEDLVLYVSRI